MHHLQFSYRTFKIKYREYSALFFFTIWWAKTHRKHRSNSDQFFIGDFLFNKSDAKTGRCWQMCGCYQVTEYNDFQLCSLTELSCDRDVLQVSLPESHSHINHPQEATTLFMSSSWWEEKRSADSSLNTLSLNVSVNLGWALIMANILKIWQVDQPLHVPYLTVLLV